MGYGQSYYTLRSVFLDRVPPPALHVHIRLFDVSTSVPIGDISASNLNTLPARSAGAPGVEVDFPETEKQVFDLWLRELWRDKDKMLQRYLDTESFVPTNGSTNGPPNKAQNAVSVKVKIRRRRELLDIFAAYILWVVGYQLWLKVRSLV